MFGKEFKKLRNEQHISLTKAAENVTAPSTLSRWENEQIEMRFDQVLELLNNIHISPLEFISITSFSSHTPFIEEIDKAVKANNSLELKQLYSKWIKIYATTLNIDDLFNAAMAANFYSSLTNIDLLPSKYVKKLETIFSDITYWNHYYISRFGNCLDLLSSRAIYGLSILIVNNISETKNSGYEYFIDTFDTLLNALTSLIETDPAKATKLSKKMSSISLSKYSLYLDIQKQFLDAILLYKATNNKQRVLEILNAVEALHRADFYEELKNIFNFLTNV